MDPAPEIAAAEAAEEIAGGALVVDVREPVEWDAGRISGAVLIPLGELGRRVEELPRDRRMVIVCRTGSRSGYAADALHGAGYGGANLRGGLFAWTAGSLPLEPDGGYVL
jgi:hydroxyacylglutathione hydrolase